MILFLVRLNPLDCKLLEGHGWQKGGTLPLQQEAALSASAPPNPQSRLIPDEAGAFRKGSPREKAAFPLFAPLQSPDRRCKTQM